MIAKAALEILMYGMKADSVGQKFHVEIMLITSSKEICRALGEKIVEEGEVLGDVMISQENLNGFFGQMCGMCYIICPKKLIESKMRLLNII